MTIEDPIHVALCIVDMLQLAGTQWMMLIDENLLLGLVYSIIWAAQPAHLLMHQ